MKMKGPIGGDCQGSSASGKIKAKGKVDSSGDFSGTFFYKVCARDSCASNTLPFGFELGAAQGGDWRLRIKDVVEGEGTRLSGRCTLQLDESAKLKFDLTGTYDEVTGTSTLKCKGRGSFSQGAKVKIEDLIVSDGEITSGSIGGRAFGQKIDTRVPGS